MPSLGAYGEQLASDYLERHGFKVLKLNARVQHLEIDLVASQKDEIILVEVKTRRLPGLVSAIDSLSKAKIKRLKRARLLYAINHKIPLIKVRLDFIAIDLYTLEKKANIKHFISITG
ncbi:YraN family protein [Candidatus Falkowbacteria bacterium]|nr:YraN family protein [Candidatus Falkowbacteria bacterium]